MFLICDRKHDEINPVRKVTRFKNVPMSAHVYRHPRVCTLGFLYLIAPTFNKRLILNNLLIIVNALTILAFLIEAAAAHGPWILL